MDVYLRAKFEVSSIILTSFRPPPHPPSPQNEPLKTLPRLGLKRRRTEHAQFKNESKTKQNTD